MYNVVNWHRLTQPETGTAHKSRCWPRTARASAYQYIKAAQKSHFRRRPFKFPSSLLPQISPVMSSTFNTNSNFETIFNAALANYTKQTGKDLRNHPLASKIDSSDNPDSILDIFQEQAQAFDEFRRGDTKLLKLLRPVVNVLHAFSTEDVLRHSISHVSPTMLLINQSQYLNTLSLRRFRTQSQFSPLSGYFYPCVSPSISLPHSLSQPRLPDGQICGGKL